MVPGWSSSSSRMSTAPVRVLAYVGGSGAGGGDRGRQVGMYSSE